MPVFSKIKMLFRKKVTNSRNATPASNDSDLKPLGVVQDNSANNQLAFASIRTQDPVTPGPEVKEMALQVARPGAPIPPTPFTHNKEEETEGTVDIGQVNTTSTSDGSVLYSFGHELDAAVHDPSALDAMSGRRFSHNTVEFKINKLAVFELSPGSPINDSPTLAKSTTAGHLLSTPGSPSTPATKSSPVIEDLAAVYSTNGNVFKELKKDEDKVEVEEVLSRFTEVFDDDNGDGDEDGKNEDETTENDDSSFESVKLVHYPSRNEPNVKNSGADFLGVPAQHGEEVKMSQPNGFQLAKKLPAPASFTSTLVSDSPINSTKPVAETSLISVVDIVQEEVSFENVPPYDGIAEETPILRRRLFARKPFRSASRSLSSLGSPVSARLAVFKENDNAQPVKKSFMKMITSVEEELRKPYTTAPTSQAAQPSPAGNSSKVSSVATPPCKVSLDDLEILKVLGKGASGQVYMVRHKKWNTRHALKIAVDIYDTKGRERRGAVGFLRDEQAILKKLNGDDGFLRLDASWSDTRNFYFIFPLYATDLESEIQRCRGFPVERARFYFAQLTIGLHTLHSRGIIHRDIKAANIMLDYEGNLIIGDFGLSEDFGMKPSLEERTYRPYWPYWSTDNVDEYTPPRPVDTLPFALTRFCGSPHHLAPEIWLEQPYSFGVDWWAAATVLFDMVTGRLPFWTPLSAPQEDLKTKIILEDIHFRIGEQVDANTKDLLRKMLKKNPEERLPIVQMENHPFFGTTDWDAMRRREVAPPYVPPRQSTHIIHERIHEFIRGGSFAEGGNPYPEFEYTSPDMLSGTYEEKEKMQDGDIEETNLIGSERKKLEMVSGRRLGIISGLVEKVFKPSQGEGVVFSMQGPSHPPRFYHNEPSVGIASFVDEVCVVGKAEPDFIPPLSRIRRSFEQLQRWKNRVKYAFIPRVRPQAADGPRFDLLE